MTSELPLDTLKLVSGGVPLSVELVGDGGDSGSVCVVGVVCGALVGLRASPVGS